MKHQMDEWESYSEMVVRIASEYKKRYQMVEHDDLVQEQNLWFVSHPRKFKEWLSLPDKERDRLVAKSLRNQVLKYCEKEKARQQGYDITDLYYYDVSVVEAFLPTIIVESYEMPAKIKDLNFKFGGGEISDGMNWLALRADIAGAYEKLSEAKQNILRLRFMDESADWSTLATAWDTSADGARMKVQRALASLVQHLGGWRPYHDEEPQQEEEHVDDEREYDLPED
jgi:RNA polymerase sigma factor (sigma-70 family)